MSGLVAIGLVCSIGVVIGYVATAGVKRKKPELCDAMSVFLSSVSFLAAVRLIGCAFSSSFAKVIAAQSDVEEFWKLTQEDLPLVALAGIALGWVSIQVIWEVFAKLRTDSVARARFPGPPTPPIPKRTGAM